MENIKEMPTYLCGGVVFTLITSTAYKNGTSNPKYPHERSVNHSDPQIMADLLTVLTGITPASPSSQRFRTATSDYKRCKKTNNEQLYFLGGVLHKPFEEIPQETYKEIVKKMDAFIERHINFNLKDDLIKMILHIIKNDSEINDDAPFYVKDNTTPISKSELLNVSNVSPAYFLVGIMHYILKYRTPGDLEKGQKTLSIFRNEANAYSPLTIGDLSLITRDYKVKVDAKKENIVLDLFKSNHVVSNAGFQSVYIDVLKEFKTDFDPIISTFTECEFETIILDEKLVDYIKELVHDIWYKTKLETILEPKIVKLLEAPMQTIFELLQFTTPQYMRRYNTDSGERMIIKQESFEDKEQLENIVKPKTRELRAKLKEQYAAICEMIHPKEQSSDEYL